MKSNLFLLLLSGIFFSCQPAIDPDPYTSDLEQWHKDRLASLTRVDGWTTLIGLHWLEDGNHTFGSSEENDIVFPEKMPAHMGVFSLSGDSLSVHINDDVDILINGTIEKSALLKSDMEAQPTYLNWKSFTWYVIERGGKYGIRIKDSLATQRLTLKEIPHYPVDENWKFKATLVPPNPGATIKIENILGQVSDNPLEGKLEFTYQGKNYQLAALDGGQDAYFVIMADETTGEETYGGGRYIYVEKVDSSGLTFIDFNKAFNPPCVFSVFATCPLPPQENYLPFRVLAGEKNLPHH